MQLSIIGLAEVMPVYEAMQDAKSMRNLIQELTHYRTDRAHSPELLIDPVIGETVAETTRLFSEARKGRIEISADSRSSMT